MLLCFAFFAMLLCFAMSLLRVAIFLSYLAMLDYAFVMFCYRNAKGDGDDVEEM